MTGWAAIVPLKAEGARKSRLSPALSPRQRGDLAERLYTHVIGSMKASGLFDRIIVLSPAPPPGDLAVEWRQDAEAPINAALDKLRAELGRLMVINADLPLLDVEDLEALASSAAAHSAAIAPDRHGIGTNAIALMAPTIFAFAFGDRSFAAHRLAARASGVVERPGLAYDIDMVEDIDAVLALDGISDRVKALLATGIWNP